MTGGAGSPPGRFPPPPAWAPAAVLFVLALSAGLLFASRAPLPEPENDAAEYLALARHVAAGEGFSYDGATPAVYRPPLFSGLLGGWFAATGTSSVRSAAVFQSFLHALGVVASFLLFRELCPSLGWAAGAALFLSVNPLLVTRVAFVLQEPTLLLVTTVAAWRSVRLVKDPTPARAALAGASWGVCALGKIVCWFAPLLLLSMRLLPARLRRSWRGREAAALLVCFVAAIAPWTLRNRVHFGRFIPVNDQGAGLLEWSVAHAEPPGGSPGRELVEEADRGGWPGPARSEAMWGYVRGHARYFLVERVVRNAVRFAAPARDWWIARGRFRPGESRALFWILAGLFHVPLYLFLLHRTWRWGRGTAAPLLGFPVLFYWVYWAEHAVFLGDPRYGLAVYPVLVSMILPATDSPRNPRDPAAPHRRGTDRTACG